MVKNKTFRIDDEHETKLKDLAKSNGVFESKIIELGIDEIFNKYNLSDQNITQNSGWSSSYK